MRKKYKSPSIKGHRIKIYQMICESNYRLGSGGPAGGDNNSKSAYNRGGFFEDEEPVQSATKEHDFAYGL